MSFFLSQSLFQNLALLLILGLSIGSFSKCCCVRSYKKILTPLGKSGAFVAREFLEKLDEDINRYNFLAENVPCIIWSGDKDGNPIYYNQQWYDYTGLSLDDTKTDGWKTVVHPDDLNNCIEIRDKNILSKQSYSLKLRLLRNQDKTYRWHLTKAAPRYDKNGEIVQWVGSCIDIEDAK